MSRSQPNTCWSLCVLATTRICGNHAVGVQTMTRSFNRTGTRHAFEAREVRWGRELANARRVDAWPYDIERERLARLSAAQWQRDVELHKREMPMRFHT